MEKQITEVFRKATTRVKSIAMHPVYSTFITGNHCGTIYLWSMDYLGIERGLKGHSGSVRSVAFHGSGEIFASGGDDKAVKIWNYRTMEVMKVLEGHTDYVRSVSFHPTHPWVISCSDDCTVKVWNYVTGNLVSTTSGHQHYVMSGLFLDSTHFVTASLDHSIGVWDCSKLFEKSGLFSLQTSVLIQSLEAHSQGVNALFFSGKRLYSAGDDREIKVWKYAEGTLTLENSLYGGHEGNVTAVCSQGDECFSVSEDGKLILCKVTRASRSISKTIDIGSRLWAVKSKGSYIVVGSDDGLIVYKYANIIIAERSNEAVWYVDTKKLRKLNAETWEHEEEYSLKKRVKTLIKSSNDGSVCIAYEDGSYETVSDNGKVIGSGNGCAIKTEKYIYSFFNGTITRKSLNSDDQSVIWECNREAELYSFKDNLFVVTGHTLRYFVESEDTQPLIYNSGFDIKRVLTTSYCFSVGESLSTEHSEDAVVALLGEFKLVMLSVKAGEIVPLAAPIQEYSKILGGLFVEGRVLGKSLAFFIYATERQVKYFYLKPGILLSVDFPLLPLGVSKISSGGDALVAASESGIKLIPISFSELFFREAVQSGSPGDIEEVIMKEHLPGRIPLVYLLSTGKASLALPYVKEDLRSKLDILLSSGMYSEAYQLCESPQDFSRLGVAAARGCAADIAERCFRQINDIPSLFFLFLSTRQFEKLSSLKNTVVGGMVDVIEEDTRVAARAVGLLEIPKSVTEELSSLRINSLPEQSTAVIPGDNELRDNKEDSVENKQDDDISESVNDVE